MNGEVIDTGSRLIRRVMGTARWKGDPGNRGRPDGGEGGGLDVARAAASAESDRVVDLIRPGIRGGKALDF